MKHTSMLLWFIILILASVLVQAQTLPNTQSSLDVNETTVNIQMSQSQTKTALIHVKNTGSRDIRLEFDTRALDLLDNDGDRITISFSDPGVILPGDTKEVTITLVADRELDFELYGGTVTVKDRNSTAQDTFTLNIQVTPDICDFGEVPNGLVMDIEDPDESEEVEPGESLHVRINVMNNGRNDRRVQVEAFLFAEAGRKIAEAASESKNIEDGEDEDFSFDVQIPIRSELIGDVDDDFALFVKAFDDNNERLACIQQSRVIDLDLPRRKLVVDPVNTRFFPNVVSCGDTAVANVRLVSLGEDDATATLILENTELKIRQTIPNIRIEGFASEERSIATRQIDVSIPKKVQKKDYIFNLRVESEAGSAVSTLPLSVVSCDDGLLVAGMQTAGILIIQDKSITTVPGETVVIPVELTSNLKKKASFTLTTRNIGQFAVGSVKSVMLSPGQKTTMFIEVAIKQDAAPATYSAIVELSTNEGIVAADAITIEVTQEQKQVASLVDLLARLPLGFWIVLNVVLAGLAVLSLRIVTSLRQKT